MRQTALIVLAALAAPVAAKEFAPRSDLEIVALDAATGAVKWKHAAALSNAHFELYAGVLAVYPHYDRADKSNPIFLDPATGAETKTAPTKLVAASWAQWIKAPVVLANGWRMDNFEQGNTKELAFVDPKTSKTAWTIKPAHYPEYVLAYKQLALVAYGYLTNEAVIFAHDSTKKKLAWSIDFNKLLKTTKPRLGRVAPQLIGDVLYAQTGPHVFAIEPATGKVLWHVDAAAKLGIKYEPDLYGGALDVAVFSRDQDTLVVSFEKRVLALRAGTGELLWSIEPDTFPHSAFPLASGGVVYMTAGPKRGKASVP